ncbi:hypothetical protein NDU88_002134 [Pleurodeles waltl]|uniref:Uncharacterized protein n=1 Tax=Pleurodeles waltl TaxID=8319 RepID=A0AAV7WPB4_PLEWA|nr:hypothetical protein NDU88_002134 [Pleurodeles waltl]
MLPTHAGSCKPPPLPLLSPPLSGRVPRDAGGLPVILLPVSASDAVPPQMRRRLRPRDPEWAGQEGLAITRPPCCSKLIISNE